MVRRNIFAALVLLAVGTWYGVMTALLPDREMPNTPGPAFFPWLITGGLTVLAAALLIRGLVAVPNDPGQAPPVGIAYNGRFALILFAVYLVALPYAGFVLASIPFFAGLIILYGGRNKLFVTLAAVAVPVAMFCLFRFGFLIPLPQGVWQ